MKVKDAIKEIEKVTRSIKLLMDPESDIEDNDIDDVIHQLRRYKNILCESEIYVDLE